MQTTLLSTKLFIPLLRERLVARPRLTAILSDALGKGLTMISAPAGYGKTTLVSSWLQEANLPCAWLSLEESDNDPVRFLQYLLTALHEVIPEIRLDLLDMVEGIRLASYQAVVSILINQISNQTNRFVLVMDDFHLIQDQMILDIISFLLDHLPSQQMQLILITRTDPPLPLSRLRVRNQMVEIRVEQLRFTQAEVTEFVNGLMGFSLSDEEISAMYARTEGWIAGLQLAGLSMRECTDLQGFIAAFSGSHHYIVDYLAEEVLKRQDEQTRAFLLQTSILSRMCGSLCEALVDIKTTGQPIDGQLMLENLQKKNLFIMPLDEDRLWFRYHHLFADALNRRLEYQHPELITPLYRCASVWYEHNALISEAIQYALSAGDQERVAQLVEQNGCYLLMSGEVLTLLKWMESIERYFPEHPWLVIQKAWALTMAGRMEPAEQAFQIAESLVSGLEPSPDVNTMVGTISAGRAYWADVQGNIPEAARLAQRALQSLTEMDGMSQSMRSVATATLAKTSFLSGELERARQIYDQALKLSKAADNIEMVIINNSELSDILWEQGKLRQTKLLLLETLAMTMRADGQRFPIAASIYSGLSRIYYEWNQIKQADHYTNLGLEISQQWGSNQQIAIGTMMAAKIEQAKGNLERCQKLMGIVHQLNQDNRFYPWTAIQLGAGLDQYWLSVGNLEKVSQRLSTAGIDQVGEITFLYEYSYLTRLRWLLVSGDYDAALKLAQRMLRFAERGRQSLLVVELLILQSLAFLGMKDITNAAAQIALAVSLAQPEGYRRVFIDAGEGVRKLLYLVKANPDIAGYTNELLEAFGTGAGQAPDQSQLLLEPLSEREIEVLRLIQAGLSNQEIGAKLYISMGTVKRHISNIYSKLDVKNRTQAIARGNEIGLF